VAEMSAVAELTVGLEMQAAVSERPVVAFGKPAVAVGRSVVVAGRPAVAPGRSAVGAGRSEVGGTAAALAAAVLRRPGTAGTGTD
jgi:hypothetical protein